jgi:low temperature requirement protein LtrA
VVGKSGSTGRSVRHLRRRDGNRQETTPTELFFDLVYVFAVTQISHLVIDGTPTAFGAGFREHRLEVAGADGRSAS